MRVLGVVDRGIRVHIHDVVAGDVLGFCGNESGPIITKVERDGELVRFHYLPRGPKDHRPMMSLWMDPEIGSSCFINDLKGERFEFLAQQAEQEEGAA